MESVYFYDKKIETEIIKVLKDDVFMRVSYVIKDPPPSSTRDGHFLYIQANPEEIKLLEEKLMTLSVEKIMGDEKIMIIDAIMAEEENAASGIGMIFG